MQVTEKTSVKREQEEQGYTITCTNPVNLLMRWLKSSNFLGNREATDGLLVKITSASGRMWLIKIHACD